MGQDYLEVRYEDLVQNPRDFLRRLASFIEHDLDYERIQSVALGSVHDPNSSFRGDDGGQEKNPVGRWKTLLKPDEIAELESAIGDLLLETGYPPVTPEDRRPPTLPVRIMEALYPSYFDFKLWLKSSTPLAKTADLGRMGIRKS